MRVNYMMIIMISIISAKLHIIGPESLKEQFKSSNQTMEVVYANFGHIPYGQSMVGKLHYNNTNRFGCKKTDTFFNDTEEG